MILEGSFPAGSGIDVSVNPAIDPGVFHFKVRPASDHSADAEDSDA